MDSVSRIATKQFKAMYFQNDDLNYFYKFSAKFMLKGFSSKKSENLVTLFL